MIDKDEKQLLDPYLVNLVRQFGFEEISISELPVRMQKIWRHHMGDAQETCGYSLLPRESLKYAFMMYQPNRDFTEFEKYHNWYRRRHGTQRFEVFPLLINLFDDERPFLLNSEVRLHDYMNRLSLIPTIHQSIGLPRWKTLA